MKSTFYRSKSLHFVCKVAQKGVIIISSNFHNKKVSLKLWTVWHWTIPFSDTFEQHGYKIDCVKLVDVVVIGL